MLNKPSLAKSVVGREWNPFNSLILRPFQIPLTILTLQALKDLYWHYNDRHNP